MKLHVLSPLHNRRRILPRRAKSRQFETLSRFYINLPQGCVSKAAEVIQAVTPDGSDQSLHIASGWRVRTGLLSCSCLGFVGGTHTHRSCPDLAAGNAVRSLPEKLRPSVTPSMPPWDAPSR